MRRGLERLSLGHECSVEGGRCYSSYYYFLHARQQKAEHSECRLEMWTSTGDFNLFLLRGRPLPTSPAPSPMLTMKATPPPLHKVSAAASLTLHVLLLHRDQDHLPKNERMRRLIAQAIQLCPQTRIWHSSIPKACGYLGLHP